MARRVRFRAILALCAVLPLVLAPPADRAAAYEGRPNIDVARAMFDRLATRDRNELYLMLIATGDFNAMASDQFGPRLYDAIASFQSKQGLEPDGVVSPETFRRLSQVGGRIFNSWGFSFLDHPTAEASIVVPDRFGFTRTATTRGWALANANRSVSIDFAFFPAGDADLATVFARLTEPQRGRRIDMKVLRDDFFAVAGAAGAMGTYSRFIPVPGGIAGFTIAWNPSAYPNANRIAIVMANELYPHRMADAPGDLFETRPGGAPGVETTPIGPLYTPSPVEQQRDQERIAERERVLEEQRLKDQKLQEERLALQQHTEEARREAMDRLRQERFERATTTAKALLDDASAFVKAEPSNPKVLDYVQAIGQLNETLSGSDPDEAERQTAALGGALKRDPKFARFQDEQAKARQQRNARYLADAVKALGTRKAYLLKAVTQDPTSANARTLLPFIKDADAALSAPDLDGVQAAMGRIDLAVQDAGLKKDFASFQIKEDAQKGLTLTAPRSDPGDGDVAPRTVPVPLPTLTATEKNRFLLVGDLKDYVLMYNASAKAPHVSKNLRGDIVFDGRAEVCLFGRDGPDDTLGPVVTDVLAKYLGDKPVVLAPGICDADQFTSKDVVAVRRGTFLHQNPQYALALISAIESDDFKSLVTVSDAQMKSDAAAEAVQATVIGSDVDAGRKDGFGLLMLKPDLPVVCMAVGDPLDAHERVMSLRKERLARDLGDAPTFAPTSVEAAFLSAKRGQCGAIYAAAPDLKQLAAGLTRDNVPFQFSSLWFTPAEITAAEPKPAAEKTASGLPGGRER